MATGRERLAAALRHPSRGQVLVGVLVGALAFAGVTQVRLQRSTDVYAAMPQADLVQVLSGLNVAADRAQRQIDQLRRTEHGLTTRGRRRATAIAQARSEVAALSVLTGTVPATGPGVLIRITDPSHQVGSSTMLEGIEELRDAGAEAIEVEGRGGSVRVVAQTAMTDSGTGLRMGGRQLASPYTILAIGDPGTLQRGVRFPGGFAYQVRLHRAGFSVVRQPKVLVRATVPPPNPRYVAPVPQQ